MKIAPIPSYFIYDGFEKDLYAAIVYKRLMYSAESSHMRSHALEFLRSCMIGQWILNDIKPFLPQSQLFGILPQDVRRWALSLLIQILPR